jgi:hypothetical protein
VCKLLAAHNMRLLTLLLLSSGSLCCPSCCAATWNSVLSFLHPLLLPPVPADAMWTCAGRDGACWAH